MSGDGVVTLNDKVGQPNLAAALAAGGHRDDAPSGPGAKPDHKLAEIKFRAGHPAAE